MPIEGLHQYTKEGHKNNYFDNEADMMTFLSQFENKIFEYNITKVKGFLKNLGLETNYPIFALSTENYRAAIELQPININLQAGSFGEVDSMSRVIILRIDDELEVKNGGQLFTESILVHEIAHRDSFKYTITNYEENKNNKLVNVKNYRTGFGIHNGLENEKNVILEEGFAEFVRYKFLKENWSDYPLSRFAKSPDSTFSVNMPNIELTQMPASSVHLDKEGNFQNCLPGSALQVIRLLIRLNPDIEKNMFLARKSTPEYIKLIQNIEKIKKGMYPKIRSTIYNAENSAKLANEIAQLLDDLKERKLYM